MSLLGIGSKGLLGDYYIRNPISYRTVDIQQNRDDKGRFSHGFCDTLEEVKGQYQSRVTLLEKQVEDLEKLVKTLEETISSKNEIIENNKEIIAMLKKELGKAK